MFAGYSGWGPGQLEGEMERKAWLTYPASLELVLETDPATLWQKVLQSMGPKYKLLSSDAGGFVPELTAVMLSTRSCTLSGQAIFFRPAECLHLRKLRHSARGRFEGSGHQRLRI